MTKLYVICGHGNGDSGSVGGGKTEADLVRKLAAKMKAIGGSSVEVLDTSKNWYAQNLVNSALKKKVGKNPVIELHMDWASGSAKGGHVIIDADLSADKYDKALAKYIAKEFPGRAEKLVKRNNLANLNSAQAQGINYRLLECCFISNKGDREKFIEDMDEVAAGILGSFGIGSSNPSTPAASTPGASKPVAKPSSKFGGTYRCNVSKLNVRDKPSTSGNVVASYSKGQTVVLDNTYTIANGYVWGTYIGASGKRRYIAVGKHTGKPEASDYLVKVG